MSLLVAALDREAAGHLVAAIQAHRERLETANYPCPPALVDLQHAATEANRRDPDTEPDTPRTWADHEGGDELLDATAAARLMDVSERTIRRRLDRGDLAYTVINGRRKIKRADLLSHGDHRGPSAPHGMPDSRSVPASATTTGTA